MVCTANDLLAWKDFPKGLRVLLLDEDTSSAAEMKSKLEAMDYFVSTFCNESEALSAISHKPEGFHVAIVEVTTSNSNGSFKFLEAAKDLPTIMTSNFQCLSTMMKCIALGAVEFLHKPLSEDKLRNIWQHVVHKAFNAGASVLLESLKPAKDSVVSMLQLSVESEDTKKEIIEKTETSMSQPHENDHEQSPASDKYPAPSTPQPKQGGRLFDDGNCQDNINSTAKDSGGQEGESKSVETTCAAEVSLQMAHLKSLKGTLIRKEDDLADGAKCENNNKPNSEFKNGLNNYSTDDKDTSKTSGHHTPSRTRVNRKKMKVDWTPELHKKFVQAVEQLGLDQAIPSRILELMKVEGLTRHNVASHLQKYRMHKRHILPKEDDRRWQQQRDQLQRSYYPHKPIMAYPPYHSNHGFLPGPIYPIWGANGSHMAGVQMWGPTGYPPWPTTESCHWGPYHGNASGFHNTVMVDNSSGMQQNSAYLHLAEEEIDKVVNEAISKPWLPLPLGLKPPSTDTVLAELSKQGMSTIPSLINCSNSH
uniref:Two-component response regulator-like APRR2 n=1 Tax=Rhizophora mucronata TaxID=61149 RepID=A0A2P2M024_RHIMU